MPAPGETWKQFKLLDPLGSGGMGEVYLAEDTALERKVALKFLPREFEEERAARERFLKEARAAAALDHPYICKIYEIGEVDRRAFIAMEYVEGITLHRRLASGALPLSQVIDLGIELAEAVEAAHKKQIVHRDIKTPNVMVTPDGHVKILDFGLAKMLAMEALADSKVDTYSGQMSSDDTGSGTVIYMSPEQVRGEPIDGRTDIFSLGVVLYEMATGTVPFQGATSGLIYDAILNLGPRPPRYHNPQLPEEIERVILKALEKDKEDRYQSARDLLTDLKRLKRETESAARRPVVKVPAGGKRKRGLALAALGAALMVAAGALFFRPGSGGPSGPIESLAVLPFENARNNPEVEYLTEGLAETLINRLSSIPKLSVKARSSSFRYRGSDVDPQQVGRELNVGAVVTGRVVQQGEQLNVQAELVDARSGAQIWGEQYRRRMADLLAVQNEIAREISKALQLQLTGEEQARLSEQPTANSEAFRSYWRGRFHWNRRTNEDFEKAIGFFESALSEDPDYALARVGLADSYLLLGTQFYGPDADFPPSVAMAKARAAAEEALRLDPTLAEAHTTLAYIDFLYHRDWEAAERNFLRAIELEPDYPVAHQWYSEFLMVMGRADEAIGEARRALALEPTSPIQSRELGYRLYQARRFSECIEQFKKTIALDPDFSATRGMLADAYWESGLTEEMLAEAEHVDERRRRLFQLLAEQRREEAIAWVDSFPKEEYSLTTLGAYYAQAGAEEKAIDHLESAFEHGVPQLLITLQRPIFNDSERLRSKPRLAELRQKLGLPP